MLFSSTTTSTAASETVAEDRSQHFFMDFDYEDCEPETVRCGNWSAQKFTPCGCPPFQGHNTRFYFSKRWVERSCWLVRNHALRWKQTKNNCVPNGCPI